MTEKELDLLRAILSLLRGIQGSYKGSMGSLKNVYLPRLDVKRIDELAERVSAWLKGESDEN